MTALRRPRLTQTDWLVAGIDTLCDRGPGALGAEPLARRMGTTKGSFYWHFIDVPAYNQALLDLWASEARAALDAATSALADTARLRESAQDIAATARSETAALRAESAIRDFGIDPARLPRAAADARGGPFVEWRAHGRKVSDLGSAIATLDKALIRMERLERTLVAMPSARPANVEMVTSSYGYRRDPFTGAAAFHSGLDFRGSRGTPIMAAAPGRVSFVGRKSGYGNVVEIDHGQGIVTRYAHLSGFAVRLGQRVAGGTSIARMGSTGRSTGPHLHFEVRLNGQAMDPRKFLEAKADVLEIKAVAQRRITDRSGTTEGKS